MRKRKMTGRQVHSLIVADNRRRVLAERKAFSAWWMAYDDRDEGSEKAAWNAWKQRAGL